MPPSLLPPGDHDGQLLFQQRLRTFRVHIPAAADGGAALLLALHGGRSNGRALAEATGLDGWGDERGCVVVYPNGTGPTEPALTWNAGRCCGPAQEHGVDDVAFLDALLVWLRKRVAFDFGRVYVVGLSNGGMMALRFAAESRGAIPPAAVASVSGPLMVERAGFRPPRPVPILHFHGTADEFIPYEGGIGPKAPQKAAFTSVAETLSAWAAANGAAAAAVEASLPMKVDDGTRVDRVFFPPELPGGAAVLHYRIHGGGHTWPGRPPRTEIVGKSTANLSALEALAEFFQLPPTAAASTVRGE